MTRRNSRWPGFYKLSVEDRRRVAAEALGIQVSDLIAAVGDGGLGCERADKIIENVVGTFSLPFALDVQVNGIDFIAPMVVEEPSVVAAASNAARMVREGGGFSAEADDPIMISQVQLVGVRDTGHAKKKIEAHASEIVSACDKAYPSLLARGGGTRGIEVRVLE